MLSKEAVRACMGLHIVRMGSRFAMAAFVTLTGTKGLLLLSGLVYSR